MHSHFLSLVFYFKGLTQLICARVLDCNLQKMSGNLKLKICWKSNRDSQNWDWKPRVGIWVDTTVLWGLQLRSCSRCKLVCCHQKMTPSLPPSLPVKDPRLLPSDLHFRRLRLVGWTWHTCLSLIQEVERARGPTVFLWRQEHFLTQAVGHVGFREISGANRNEGLDAKLSKND